MALNQKKSLAQAMVELLPAIAALDGGTIEVYDGVQPATADTPVTTQTLLITFNYGVVAFGVPISNIAVANAIAPAVAIATGFPTWFRAKDSGAGTRFDGSAGDGSIGTFNMMLNGAGIASGQSVTVTLHTYEIPLG